MLLHNFREAELEKELYLWTSLLMEETDNKRTGIAKALCCNLGAEGIYQESNRYSRHVLPKGSFVHICLKMWRSRMFCFPLFWGGDPEGDLSSLPWFITVPSTAFSTFPHALSTTSFLASKWMWANHGPCVSLDNWQVISTLQYTKGPGARSICTIDASRTVTQDLQHINTAMAKTGTEHIWWPTKSCYVSSSRGWWDNLQELLFWASLSVLDVDKLT